MWTKFLTSGFFLKSPHSQVTALQSITAQNTEIKNFEFRAQNMFVWVVFGVEFKFDVRFGQKRVFCVVSTFLREFLAHL